MSFQLFPPPPRKPKRQISLQRPAKPASPEPAVELHDRAQAPADFHELVIKVNSNPSSPISTPPPAHVGSSTAGRSQPKISIPNTAKGRVRADSARSGDGRTTPNLGGQPGRPPDTTSPKQPSLSGDTISPVSHQDRQITGSPSFSDSSTLVRSQSTATHCTKLSKTSPKETPVMQSIFPRYNPNLPLAQQHYKPTQTSPTHIPKDKISRKPYSPTFYVPHANVLRSASAEEPYYTPKIELGALWDAANGKARPEARRTYSLQMHCQKASPDSSPVDGSTFVFGSSPIQPFYSLEQALADHSADTSEEPQTCEVLISRNNPFPGKSQTLPVAHLAIHPPPPRAPPPPQPESYYQHAQATHITTIHPQLATLAALEAAAQSPRASQIASFDPRASSAAAAQLAADAVADCAAKHSCQLFHCPVAEPLMPPYDVGKTATYELRHPALGAFPVVVQGNVARSLQPAPSASAAPATVITLLNPFAAPRAAAAAAAEEEEAEERERPPTPAPDEVLARLSVHTAALTIDAAAIAALGSDKTNPHAHTPLPYLLDVAVCAVLAVLAAERQRDGGVVEEPLPPPTTTQPVVYGGGQWPVVFAGPPRQASGGEGGWREKVRPWSWGWWWGEDGGKVAKRKEKGRKRAEKMRRGRKGVVDIELGERRGGGGEREEGEGEGEKLHWVVGLVLALLMFAFKVVVLLVRVGIKVVAGVVVVLGRCVAKA